MYHRCMIQNTITYNCRVCGSPNIVRNGANRCGQAQYHCKDCDAYRVLKPVPVYSEAQKQTILNAYRSAPASRPATHLRRGPPDGHALAQSVCSVCRISRTRSSRPSRTTCWNLTSYGRLCSKRMPNAGSGSHYVAAPVKWWPSSSAIAATPPVASCGTRPRKLSHLP